MEEIKKIIRMYFKSLYSMYQGYIEEMDNFLDRYKIPKVNQDQRCHLNNPTKLKEIEVVIEILQKNKQTNKQISK